MALGRPHLLTDLMSNYGVSAEDLVRKVYGDEEKQVKEGLKDLDLVIDYRNTNTDKVKRFAKAVGATDEEIAAVVADVELYKKEYKSVMDKEINEKISEIEKSIEQQKKDAYADYDERVKQTIIEKVYKKGSAWMAQKETEKATKKTKEKKATEVETVESPLEESAAPVDPFAEG